MYEFAEGPIVVDQEGDLTIKVASIAGSDPRLKRLAYKRARSRESGLARQLPRKEAEIPKVFAMAVTYVLDCEGYLEIRTIRILLPDGRQTCFLDRPSGRIGMKGDCYFLDDVDIGQLRFFLERYESRPVLRHLVKEGPEVFEEMEGEVLREDADDSFVASALRIDLENDDLND